MVDRKLKVLNELLSDSALLDKVKNSIDNSVNIFDILKITSAELRHSNILAWILDPNENHGFGDIFIKRLTAYIAKRCCFDEQVDALFRCNHSSFTVRREWRNIDLLVKSSESKIVIAIENKIYSDEHGDQLARYRETVELSFPDYVRFYLFLTPDGNDSSEPEIWRSIGYDDLASGIAEYLESINLCTESIQILKQYYAILRREFMGHSDEVVELCNQIYEKHKVALDLIYEIRKENDNDFFDPFGIWADEWNVNGLISDYTLDVARTICFRTPFLDEYFPTGKNKKWKKGWLCYYAVVPLPFANKVFFEFKFDRNTINDESVVKFDKIKSSFNYENQYDIKTYHRLKTWKISEYEKDNFAEVSSYLKLEIERILTHEISKSEKIIDAILQS